MPQLRNSRKNGSRQIDLFPHSKRPVIPLADDHPLVVLADTVDWTEMEARAQQIRSKKLKNAAGRPPQLRATLGALALMAVRYRPYRDVHDLIRYYAPARYLCGLTETDWTPDFRTVHDFARLWGEDGIKLINEGVVTQAKKLGFADALMLEMAKLVEGLSFRLGQTLEQACTAGRRLRRHALVAHDKLCRL